MERILLQQKVSLTQWILITKVKQVIKETLPIHIITWYVLNTILSESTSSLNTILDRVLFFGDIFISNPGYPVHVLWARVAYGTTYEEHIQSSSSNSDTHSEEQQPLKDSQLEVSCDYDMPDLVKRSYELAKEKGQEESPKESGTGSELLDFPRQFIKDLVQLFTDVSRFPIHVVMSAGTLMKGEQQPSANVSAANSGELEVSLASTQQTGPTPVQSPINRLEKSLAAAEQAHGSITTADDTSNQTGDSSKPLSNLLIDFPRDVWQTFCSALMLPVYVLTEALKRSNGSAAAVPTSDTAAEDQPQPVRSISTLHVDFPRDCCQTIVFALKFPFHILNQLLTVLIQGGNAVASQEKKSLSEEEPGGPSKPLSTLLTDFPKDVYSTFLFALQCPVHWVLKSVENVAWKEAPSAALELFKQFADDVLNTFIQGAMLFLQIFTWGSPQDILDFFKKFALDLIGTFQQAFGCFLAIPVLLSSMKLFKKREENEETLDTMCKEEVAIKLSTETKVQATEGEDSPTLSSAPKSVLDFHVSFVTDLKDTAIFAGKFFFWLLFHWPKRIVQNTQASGLANLLMLPVKGAVLTKDAIKWLIEQLLKKSEEQKLEEEFDLDDLDLDELLKLLKAAEDDIGSLDMLKKKVESARKPKKLVDNKAGEEEEAVEMNVDTLKKVVEKKDAKRKQAEAERLAKEAAEKAAREAKIKAEEAAAKEAKIKAEKVAAKEAEKVRADQIQMQKVKKLQAHKVEVQEDHITSEKASRTQARKGKQQQHVDWEDKQNDREEVVEEWIVPEEAYQTYKKKTGQQQKVEVEEEIIVPQKAYLTTNQKEGRVEVEEEIIIPQKAYLTTSSKSRQPRMEVEEEISVPEKAYMTTKDKSGFKMKKQPPEERVEVEEELIVPEDSYLLYRTGDQKTDAILGKHKVRQINMEKELAAQIQSEQDDLEYEDDEDMEEEFKSVYAQGRSAAAKIKTEVSKGLTRKPSPIIKVQRAVAVQTTKDAACDTADFPQDDDDEEEVALDDSKLMPKTTLKTKCRSGSKPRTLLDKVRKSMAHEESSDLEDEEEDLRKSSSAHQEAKRSKYGSDLSKKKPSKMSPNPDRPKSKNSSASYSHFSSEEISDSDFIGDWDDSVCESPILPKNHPLSRSSSFRKSLTTRPNSSAGNVEVRRSASGIDISIPIKGAEQFKSSGGDSALGSESYDMFAKAVQETTEKFERTLAHIADQYANAITEQSYQLKRSFSEQNFGRTTFSRVSDYSEDLDSGDGYSRRNRYDSGSPAETSSSRMDRDGFSRRSVNDSTSESKKKTSPPFTRDSFSRHSTGGTSRRQDHSTSPCRTPNLHSVSPRFQSNYSSRERYADRHRPVSYTHLTLPTTPYV